MSEALAAFQAQLSGLMETVFKAAMYEIVRLVEDSFVEEVSRSREQVEALRKRLQWAEGRRREAERCAQCGKAAVWGPEHGGPEGGRGLKQEGGAEGRWSSCPKGEEEEKEQEEEGGLAAAKAPEEASGPGALHAPELAGAKDRERDAALKEETREEAPCRARLQGPWEPRVDGAEQPSSVSVHRRDSEAQWGCMEGPGRATQGFGETDLLSTPQEGHGHIAKALSLTGPRQHTGGSKMNKMAGGLRTTFAQVVGGPRGVSQVKLQLVAECLSASRSADCEAQSDSDGRASFKQEEVQLAEWGRDTRSEDVFVQEAAAGAVQPGTEVNLSSSERMIRALGTYSKWEEPSLEAGVQRHPLLGDPVTVRGGAERSAVKSPAEGAGSPYRKSNQGPTRICTTDKPPASAHFGRGFTQVLGVKAASKQPPHSCVQCGKSFSHSCHLKAHQQIHTGERPFVCALCGRSFTKLSNLKAHRRVHTGERPYVCTECGKRFTQKCNLKRHQRIHAAERLFICK